MEDIPTLLAIIDDLKCIITELRAENAHLKARIAELEIQLNQNSWNSSRPPSMDGFRRPQAPRTKGERPPGGQKEHKGFCQWRCKIPHFRRDKIPHPITLIDAPEGCGNANDGRILNPTFPSKVFELHFSYDLSEIDHQYCQRGVICTSNQIFVISTVNSGFYRLC